MEFTPAKFQQALDNVRQAERDYQAAVEAEMKALEARNQARLATERALTAKNDARAKLHTLEAAYINRE